MKGFWRRISNNDSLGILGEDHVNFIKTLLKEVMQEIRVSDRPNFNGDNNTAATKAYQNNLLQMQDLIIQTDGKYTDSDPETSLVALVALALKECFVDRQKLVQDQYIKNRDGVFSQITQDQRDKIKSAVKSSLIDKVSCLKVKGGGKIGFANQAEIFKQFLAGKLNGEFSDKVLCHSFMNFKQSAAFAQAADDELKGPALTTEEMTQWCGRRPNFNPSTNNISLIRATISAMTKSLEESKNDLDWKEKFEKFNLRFSANLEEGFSSLKIENKSSSISQALKKELISNFTGSIELTNRKEKFTDYICSGIDDRIKQAKKTKTYAIMNSNNSFGNDAKQGVYAMLGAFIAKYITSYNALEDVIKEAKEDAIEKAAEALASSQSESKSIDPIDHEQLIPGLDLFKIITETRDSTVTRCRNSLAVPDLKGFYSENGVNFSNEDPTKRNMEQQEKYENLDKISSTIIAEVIKREELRHLMGDSKKIYSCITKDPDLRSSLIQVFEGQDFKPEKLDEFKSTLSSRLDKKDNLYNELFSRSKEIEDIKKEYCGGGLSIDKRDVNGKSLAVQQKRASVLTPPKISLSKASHHAHSKSMGYTPPSIVMKSSQFSAVVSSNALTLQLLPGAGDVSSDSSDSSRSPTPSSRVETSSSALSNSPAHSPRGGSSKGAAGGPSK